MKSIVRAAIGLAITLTFTACGEHSLEEIFGLGSSSSEEEEYSSSSLRQSSSSHLNSSSEEEPLSSSSNSSSDISSSNSSSNISSSSSRLGTASSSSQQQSGDRGTFTDTRNNKTYKTTRIGTQNWMAENLNIETGNSVCYNNDQANCTKYGRLYDWATAMEACPSDWHLPSNEEWEELLHYADGTSRAASPYKSETAGKRLKTTGTDDLGFSAVLGGYRYNGSFSRLNLIGDWWTSTATTTTNAYRRFMSSTADFVDYSSDSKSSYLFSVRCLQGSTPANLEYTGGSCNINDYKTVQIGTQTWMAENYACYVPGSKCYYNDSANCAKYGRLYDWATALDLPSSCNSSACASRISAKHKGICPAGWHIPSDADWNVLMKFVNPSCKDDSHCPDAGTKLKAANGWTEDGGTDNFGFTALPGGGYDGSFYGIGYYGNWWSASEVNGDNAYSRSMSYNYTLVSYIDWIDHSKDFLRSTRCVKD